MGFFRFLFFVVLLCLFAYCGSTTKFGKRTLFGHIEAIWKTDEAQDMVDGVKEKSGPAIDKLQRGIAAGAKEIAKEE